MSWGSSTADESKPNWKWLLKPTNAPKSANVVATPAGWVHRWPWGDEVIVAIGGLDTNLGVPTMVGVDLVSTTVGNVNPATVTFRLNFNEGVTVNGTPTLVAIGTGNTANVTLSYSAAASDPTNGKLVFSNTTADLSGSVEAVDTLVVNASSTFQGDKVLDRVSGTAVSNTVVGSNTVTLS